LRCFAANQSKTLPWSPASPPARAGVISRGKSYRVLVPQRLSRLQPKPGAPRDSYARTPAISPRQGNALQAPASSSRTPVPRAIHPASEKSSTITVGHQSGKYRKGCSDELIRVNLPAAKRLGRKARLLLIGAPGGEGQILPDPLALARIFLQQAAEIHFARWRF
jgi:hypothetical protein